MSEAGVVADAAFIREESNHLQRIMGQLSAEHFKEYGVVLGMDHLRNWVGGCSLRRPPGPKHGRRGTRWVPSLDTEALSRLVAFNDYSRVAGSLRLIREYRQAAGLMVRLRALVKHIDLGTGGYPFDV